MSHVDGMIEARDDHLVHGDVDVGKVTEMIDAAGCGVLSLGLEEHRNRPKSQTGAGCRDRCQAGQHPSQSDECSRHCSIPLCSTPEGASSCDHSTANQSGCHFICWHAVKHVSLD